jgi:hypothetical protein
MSEFDGLLTATSVSSARNAGSSTRAGWFIPSGAEAKKLNMSSQRVPSRASTSHDPRLALVSSTRSKPSTSRWRRSISWTRSGGTLIWKVSVRRSSARSASNVGIR